MAEVVAPTNRVGDVEESHFHDGEVTTPAAFKEAYHQYVKAGWCGVPFDPAHGGGGFPWVVGLAMQEMLNSSNMAFAMAPLLTQGAIDMLHAHASEEQKELYLRKLVSGEWTGTMNLTEPDAGSDVGALRTRAVRRSDGTYAITGTKIFISFGEHDMAENIVHLVLARTPDAPPGTRGISCFIVPKFLLDDSGGLGERNDVTCVAIEHKMGIKASPTCQLSYGDNSDGATGFLIGEENAGMRYMFTMMNNARLGVGTEGHGDAELAYQAARNYAQERRQGRAPGAEPGTSSPIVEHPDVRRMLLTQKALVEAARALCYVNAGCIDRARAHPDGAERERAQETVELLTPLCKAWGTDIGVEVSSLAIQVHGGMGYIEETGVAQIFRDARIAPIYEGTNGIQAIDLVGRKLPLRGGGVVADHLAAMRATADELAHLDGDLAAIGSGLGAGVDAATSATDWLLEHGLADPVDALAGATPYLRLLSTVVGAWLLARSAQAAQNRLDGSLPDGDERAFLEGKLATARFFVEHLLPEVQGLVAVIAAGGAGLFTITPEQF
jgi:alkylation response protein AidB-like acyl-CoA dehydrogenase